MLIFSCFRAAMLNLRPIGQVWPNEEWPVNFEDLTLIFKEIEDSSCAGSPLTSVFCPYKIPDTASHVRKSSFSLIAINGNSHYW